MKQIKCPQCGEAMQSEARKSFPYTASVGVVNVPQMRLMECDGCGEIVLPDKEVRRAEGLLVKKILNKKFLASADYGFLLHYLELSPQDAAVLFKKDKSTMSRWLSGKTPIDPLVESLILELAQEAAEGQHTLHEILRRVI